MLSYSITISQDLFFFLSRQSKPNFGSREGFKCYCYFTSLIF
jgi:hypothetical protein